MAEGRSRSRITIVQRRTAREMGRRRKPIYMHIYKCLLGHPGGPAHGDSPRTKKLYNQCTFLEQIRAGGHEAAGGGGEPRAALPTSAETQDAHKNNNTFTNNKTILSFHRTGRGRTKNRMQRSPLALLLHIVGREAERGSERESESNVAVS